MYFFLSFGLNFENLFRLLLSRLLHSNLQVQRSATDKSNAWKNDISNFQNIDIFGGILLFPHTVP